MILFLTVTSTQNSKMHGIYAENVHMKKVAAIQDSLEEGLSPEERSAKFK